ncbi:glycosyltransferase family 2 protein [Patescibacteria group bacterium]|nr:glycosyltransferase family 2 protein [Patescibacteria group bacterium]
MPSLTPENAISNPLSRDQEPRWLVQDSDVEARPDLAIVIVSWNVRELLQKNLISLQNSIGNFSAQVIVIDNASKDGTVEEVRAQFPWVTVIANTENRGFAAACNQGIRATHARHVLLLNPDMCVEADTIANAIAYADTRPEGGIFGGLLLREDGSVLPSVRRFPDFASQLAVLLKVSRFFPRIMQRYLAEDLDNSREQEVDSVRGSFFLIHEKTLRALGGLDERYFIWFEEVDYCRRAHLSGFSVRFVPSLRAHDAFGKSFSQHRLFWKQKQFSASLVTYFETWQPWWQALILRTLRVPVLVGAWVYDEILFSS